jgi:2-aminoadipate transaminase
MNDSNRSSAFDHLFTEATRRSVGEPGYGNWRTISTPDAVSLSFGFPYPDSLPNEELLSAAEAVFEAEGDQALQYGGGEYTDQLTEWIAERARNRGIDCGVSDVVVTNGATRAIDTACRAFLSPDDSLFVEAPTFMGALTLFKNFGVTVNGFDVDSDGLDVEAVAAELRARQRRDEQTPKLLYTIPNFQNPTGTTLSLSRRKRLLELASEHNFIVLEDGAYDELQYDGEQLPTLKELDDEGHVIRIGTFAKTVAPGVRTGWIIADEPLAAVLQKLGPGGTNTFTRSIVGRYCTESFDERLAELREAYERRRDHMVRCLNRSMPSEIAWTKPDGGFFIWVTFPQYVDTDELLPIAAEEGVTYLPGSLFFPDESGYNCLRLAFSHVSVDEIERGIEALGTAASATLDRAGPG